MSLRVKLLLGYLIFVVALMALGGWSAWRLRQMGSVTRLIIAENYDSVVAAQDMKESLERQDSAALFLLLGQRERAQMQMREHRQRFDAALEKAANNITEPGEVEIIAAIRRDRAAYYQEFDALVAPPNLTEQSANAPYFRRFEPLFNQLRADCDRLLRLNQQAMATKSENATQVANQWFRWTGLLAAMLVIAGLLLAVWLSQRIVRPLQALREAASKIAGGDLDTKAPIPSRDEIGILAAEFNRMAERLRQLRRSDLGQLFIAQQTTEATIDSLYDPILVTDEKGNVTKLNPAAERIFGPEAVSLGKPIAEITHDNRIAMAVSDALNWQRPVVGESIAAAIPISFNGTEQAYRLRTTPMRDEQQQLLGTVVLLENVTHLKEVDRLKSEFIATASEQLQEPVKELQMSLYCLLDEVTGELNDTQRDLLFNCREQVERWERLRQDLLDLSRIESGEQMPRLTTVKLTECLGAFLASLRLEIEGSDLAFKVDLPASLPASLADCEQIKRVLTHLIQNARHNTPRGGEIQLSAAELNDHIAISVTDTGRGIPLEFLPRLFNRFVRVPGTNSEGSGLGLAISKRLIEAHGGQISVQSEVERGTVVTFTLLKVEENVASLARRRFVSTELDQLHFAPLEKVSRDLLGVRPGGILVSARDYTSLHYLRAALAEVNTNEQDVVVMTARVESPTSAAAEPAEKQFTDTEQLLFTRALDIAEKLGKQIKLLVVPATDAFQTTVATAVQLECATLIAGVSTKMSVYQQARRIGEAWEQIPGEQKRKLRILKLIAPSAEERIFEIGAHRPTITPEDIELTHKLWLELSKNNEHLHHNEVISVALRRLAQGLSDQRHAETIAQVENLRKKA
ncbi:MAG: HAMP domain-containing protein [Acidobacteria bacterium]|nr:HAMP domain-containing protein [Acidobacteriota bacterium]